MIENKNTHTKALKFSFNFMFSIVRFSTFSFIWSTAFVLETDSDKPVAFVSFVFVR